METKFEEAVVAFGSFFFVLLGDIISLCATLSLLYAAGYIICRYLVCENDNDIWQDFANHIRSGVRGLAEAFCIAVPGIKAKVKEWVDDIMDGI